MSPQFRIVIDPGHGGTAPVGGSSPNHAKGPGGLLEKNLTLDIARRIVRYLPSTASVSLTRESDVNLSLSERARNAREQTADAFVSLHFNGSTNTADHGMRAFIARTGASPASERLASGFLRRFGNNAPVERKDLGVLLPHRHHPKTAACLLEVEYLSNPDFASAVAKEEVRDNIARQLADTIAEVVPSLLSTPHAQALDGKPRRPQPSPAAWGKERFKIGRQRFADYGADFERMCGEAFPGVPVEAFMGFTLNGGEFENTTESVAAQKFHELGMFGIEGGDRHDPAPAPGSRYEKIAKSDAFRKLAGRAGNTASGSWRPPKRPWKSVPDAIIDQIGIGLLNQNHHAGEVFNNKSIAAIKPATHDSLWFVATSFMGWSAGAGGAGRHLGLFADRLAKVSEHRRWGYFLGLLAEAGDTKAIQTGGLVMTGVKHRNPFFSALRTLQKLEAGRLLAADRGGDVGWFDEGLGARRNDIIAAITKYANEGTMGSAPASQSLNAVVGTGRETLDCPVLTDHGKTKNVILKWNVPPSSIKQVDVLVHLHGFSPIKPPYSLATKANVSGADFQNPGSGGGPLRQRPTLAIIPRGFDAGPSKTLKNTEVFTFPALTKSSADNVTKLIDWSLDWFATNPLTAPSGSLRQRRLILTAHSGGGAALREIVRYVDPDEIHMFDSMYGPAPAIATWVTEKIGRDAMELGAKTQDQWAGWMASNGGALRNQFTPSKDTTPYNTQIHDAIQCALVIVEPPELRSFLSKYYRVEQTGVAHGEVPKTFGWQILADASVDLKPKPVSLKIPAKCGGASTGAKAFSTPNFMRAGPAIRITGEDFCRKRIWGTKNSDPGAAWTARENAIFNEIKDGNFPDHLKDWIEIKVSHKGHTGIFEVLPDYLAVGTDSDFVRIPMDGITTQRVMDELDCLIPTVKMVDDIYKQAEIKAEALPRPYYKKEMGSGIRQSATDSYLEHDRAIRTQLGSYKQGKLIAGHKKDVVMTNKLQEWKSFPNLKDRFERVAIYGFFKKDGTRYQGRSVIHEVTYADYSHGVRLVNPWMTVDGKTRKISDVLADKELCGLLTDEGPMKVLRIPGSRK